jgi:glutathione synthase/RimK-type ligase-like ATP-grasp enzyme
LPAPFEVRTRDPFGTAGLERGDAADLVEADRGPVARLLQRRTGDRCATCEDAKALPKRAGAGGETTAYDAPVQIAIASFSEMPSEFGDNERLAEAVRDLGADIAIEPWDDPAVDWRGYELVVIRTTWNYARRRDEFLDWADRIGDRLHNAPSLVRWNSDKHYLGDLAAAGIPVVETRYIEPADPVPELEGEVVVKPNVSVGARETGRFGPAMHASALELVASIQESGRAAMVQPYQRNVDTVGETAVVCIDGAPAHALKKRAVLRPDEVAPRRNDAVGAAEIMYDPDLVTPAKATPAELDHARAVVAHVAERFDYLPLYARVDTIPGRDGAPVLMELEAIEPNFYLDQVPATGRRAAEAILARARSHSAIRAQRT